MPTASAQPLAASGRRSDLRRPPTGMLRAATRPPSLRRSGGRSGGRGACPHLAHVQNATWLLQGPTWCRVGRIWPASRVAGSFGTQRSGVQISPTRPGQGRFPAEALEACPPFRSFLRPEIPGGKGHQGSWPTGSTAHTAVGRAFGRSRSSPVWVLAAMFTTPRHRGLPGVVGRSRLGPRHELMR